MSRQTGPSRGAMAPELTSNNANLYGEGAPFGDPFQVAPAPVGGPVYYDAHLLGHGPPPGTPRATTRSTSLDIPAAYNRDRLGYNHARVPSPNTRAATVNSNTFAYNSSSVNTPTQSNRYHAPSRSLAPLHPQFIISEERTQMARMLEMMQTLLSDTAELKERISAVEGALSERLQPSIPARATGIAAQRGGRVTRSKRGALGLQPVTTQIMTSAALTTTRALQSYVTKTFRHVVRTNLVTQEVYPTPVFSVHVTDLRNRDLVDVVARKAQAELQNRDGWPQKLKRPSQVPGPTFDLAYLRERSKESFRNLTQMWKETQNIEAAIQGDVNRKSEQLAKVVNIFATDHHLDPGFLADLIHEQYLSDEVSGPEDEAVETRDAWKKMEMLELLVPAWRSEAYSSLIHDLENFRLDGTSPTQELNLKYTRVGLDRPSDRIPWYAPYDFGISMEWWKENNVPANKTMLKGWTKWPEPDESGLILEWDATGAIVGASYGQ
ncbi:hypothetical protein DFH08DRAFT_973215 [Mycena albidolilacea]|uniref:Uncharacterized protein n=1 Tax=Mycena albidolilacea TaxID=1033008 RepID=A0AAD7EDM7_9AGAR|nr:hypothetical protein DFH08DRAFT_973215 [Mycena albidolilacea]